MRGRRPRRLLLDPADLTILQRVARSDSLPWYQVRRARIVLANAQGVHNSTIAFQMQCNEATVWRTCRRYEWGGLTELLAPSVRPGSPGRFSPPPAGTDRPTRLPGAGGQGPAHHSLVE
jgi:Winged helix-turn helix